MKITARKLRKIIREELRRLNEREFPTIIMKNNADIVWDFKKDGSLANNRHVYVVFPENDDFVGLEWVLKQSRGVGSYFIHSLNISVRPTKLVLTHEDAGELLYGAKEADIVSTKATLHWVDKEGKEKNVEIPVKIKVSEKSYETEIRDLSPAK